MYTGAEGKCRRDSVNAIEAVRDNEPRRALRRNGVVCVEHGDEERAALEEPGKPGAKHPSEELCGST